MLVLDILVLGVVALGGILAAGLLGAAGAVVTPFVVAPADSMGGPLGCSFTSCPQAWWALLMAFFLIYLTRTSQVTSGSPSFSTSSSILS